jgi:hypothetical protein
VANLFVETLQFKVLWLTYIYGEVILQCKYNETGMYISTEMGAGCLQNRMQVMVPRRL